VAVNWAGPPWASALVGFRLTDCRRRVEDEPHAKLIATIASKKTEMPYFPIADLLGVGPRVRAKNLACLLSIISKLSCPPAFAKTAIALIDQ
jgi:hypothetical protein